MKILKFRESLSKLIIDGKKTKTWRLFDDKYLKRGDILSLCIWETGKEFAKAKIISVKELKFKDLNEKDKEGHEKFSSDNEMYETYSNYYNKQVIPETKLKVIEFKII